MGLPGHKKLEFRIRIQNSSFCWQPSSWELPTCWASHQTLDFRIRILHSSVWRLAQQVGSFQVPVWRKLLEEWRALGDSERDLLLQFLPSLES